MRAMAHQTAPRSKGDPSDLAMAAGVRKIPSAMDSPVTTAIAAQRPSCLFSFATGLIVTCCVESRIHQKDEALRSPQYVRRIVRPMEMDVHQCIHDTHSFTRVQEHERALEQTRTCA